MGTEKLKKNWKSFGLKNNRNLALRLYDFWTTFVRSLFFGHQRRTFFFLNSENFREKLKIWSKIKIVVKKIKILVKNKNFVQK